MRQIPVFFITLTLAACRPSAPAPDDAPRKKATATSQTDDDNIPGVTLTKEAQARGALKIETLAAQSIQPELIAYGKLEEDPSTAFVVRAPFAGTLHTAPQHPWPALGETLPPGGAFGTLEPRLTLTDRIGLNTQLATARSDLNSAAAAVRAVQTAYDRTRALNADDKNVSDKALQDAAARLAQEQAREAGARSLVQLLDASLATPESRPVVAERGGDVAEVLAQPGESIEQGSPILRLARFDHLLARIDFPVGQHPPAAATVRIVPAGFEDQPTLPAERVALASADPGTQGASVLYRLTRVLPGLRPGAAVTGRFNLPGSPGSGATGVLIPRAAIVQQGGRAWVYIQTKDTRFSRFPVPTDQPTEGGFVAVRGFSPGDRVVVTGAQSLLSEEFKSRNEADTN